MKQLDRAKLKIAASQMRAAKKTMGKLSFPLPDCSEVLSDKAAWSNFHLEQALAYMREALSEEYEDEV